MAAVVGRDAELSALRGFVESVSEGAAVLVLEGEAGMGKTTLWSAGVSNADERGIRVLRARPAESETDLSFAGLGDLLDPVLGDILGLLPPAQRRALSQALVLEEVSGSPPDAHAAGVALLNALRGLAGTRPVLVAIDDVQWLDAASAGAIAYAARRLRSESVGLLFSRRSGLGTTLIDELRRSFVDGRVAILEVGPLDMPALHGVVQGQLGATLPRPLLVEVHQASGGNPLFALEIVRMLQRSGFSVETGHPLPLPDSLRDLVHGRLLALPAESRDFLLAAAAHAQATVSIIEAASGVARDEGLTPALEARVVELEGDRIRFTHPLLAAGAYETSNPVRRAEVHARLAELLEDPEARASQLAACTERADHEVAAALEEAAAHARARGAPRAAALLLDRACELTPADRADDAQRRAVDAAHLHFESGDSPRAEAQLRAIIPRLVAGPQRARALVRLARVRSYERQRDAVDLFLRAIDEATDHREVLAAAHEGVAACLFRLRERLDEAVDHADLASRLALDLGDRELAAEALGTQTLAEGILGRPSAVETARRALDLQESAAERRVIGQPLFALSVFWWWTNELDAARETGISLIERSRDLGDESSLPYLLVLLGWGECLVGEYGSAFERAIEGQVLAQQAGQRTMFVYCLALEALVEAQRGNEHRARSIGAEALMQVEETAGRPAELLARSALGHLDLTLSACEDAVRWLAPAVEHARRELFGEPSAMWFVVDHVEALLSLGRIDEARELLDWYEGHARRLERISALANCARCRGLLAGVEGSVDQALAAFEHALRLHEQVELPLDRGRTLLALGAAQRRAKRRKEARATLEHAIAIFERIGAELWAERTRAELRRISGRAATPGALTPAEERVAALVAEGKTNREVAAALFLSERTVEGHLSRVFGKVGVRSRTELAHVLGAAGREIVASNTGDSPVSGEPSAP